MSFQLNCTSPRIIMNPQLPELLAKYGHYSILGKTRRVIHRSKILSDFDRRYFHPRNVGVNLDNIDDYFVQDDVSGEKFPMYLNVPCGHCSCCKSAKINSFVHRCKLESQSYDVLPWFCTFTYRDDVLPSDGVSVREMQLFMKRFRINLKRAGFNYSPRYVIVGEYGRNTHRPHYHAIFWDIRSRNEFDYLKVSDILEKSWNLGFVQRRLINLSDDKGFYYTAKYLKKDCFVPAGMNLPFMLSSRGKGGIGSRFIDSLKVEVQTTLNTAFQFLDKWTGKVTDLQWNKYILNRIFPSFSRSVSADFRRLWVSFNDAICYLKYRSSFSHDIYEKCFKTIYLSLREKISPYCFSPLPVEACFRHSVTLFSCVSSAQQFAYDCLSSFDKLADVSSFPTYWEIAEKRKRFCEKAFSDLPLISLKDKEFNIRRQFALAAAREIF